MRVNAEAITTRARDLWSWADGYEETNATRAAACRVVARDVLDLIEAYEAEQSGRVAMQANYQRCLDLISSRAYERMLSMPVLVETREPCEFCGDGPCIHGCNAVETTSNGHNPLL